jgi:hypothetical protein
MLALQRAGGNRATTHLIQTKLTVGPAGDRYEQEADQVAEQVNTRAGQPDACGARWAVQMNRALSVMHIHRVSATFL